MEIARFARAVGGFPRYLFFGMALRARLRQLWSGALPGADGDYRPAFASMLLLSAAIGGVLLALAYVALARPLQAVLVLAFSGAMLLLLRVAGRLSLAAVTHLMLSLTLLNLVGLTCSEPSVDTAMLLWFGLLPAIASLMLDWRAGGTWLLVALATSAAVGLLRPAPTAESLGAVHLMRLLAFVLTFYVISLLFGVFRERSLEAVQAATRAKSAFLATMSHEIRTPMNGVLGMAEVMLQDDPTPRQREQLAIIQQSGQVMIALLNDLLDLSKVEASKLRLEARPFGLTELLEGVTRLHASLAAGRGLELTLRREPGVPDAVVGDALRLRQVLGNLLGNAVKFTERGRVELSVQRRPDGRLRFAVEDTGVGISEASLGGLFEPFSQVDSSPRRRFGGTGLGLALCRQLVRLMGGELSVRSTEGRGSTFWFDVPLAEASAPASTEVAVAVAPPPAAPSSPSSPSSPAAAPLEAVPDPARGVVLVVDDNPINREVASALVRKAGYQVAVAEDGAEAVAAVQRQEPVLVLMDCHMPGMDGFEATARIRALHSPAARVPIVALTASAMPEELQACRRAGMDDCLTKPLGLARLRAVLARLDAGAAQPSPPGGDPASATSSPSSPGAGW